MPPALLILKNLLKRAETFQHHRLFARETEFFLQERDLLVFLRRYLDGR